MILKTLNFLFNWYDQNKKWKYLNDILFAALFFISKFNFCSFQV